MTGRRRKWKRLTIATQVKTGLRKRQGLFSLLKMFSKHLYQEWTIIAKVLKKLKTLKTNCTTHPYYQATGTKQLLDLHS